MAHFFPVLYSRPELIAARVPKDPDQQVQFLKVKEGKSTMHLTDSGNANPEESVHDYAKYLVAQKKLFWFGHPSFVMGLFQLIQLGKLHIFL